MPELFVIMGKSSSGKDTIFNKLMNDKRLELSPVVIYTTRPARCGEKNGREYFFTDEEHVKEYERQKKIIEMRTYNTVQGLWKYFTVDDGQIDRQSRKKYVIIGTLDSFEKLRDYYGKDIVIPIYIEVSDRIRIHRALEREDRQNSPDYKEMCRRYIADEKDFSEERLKKLEINERYCNENLEECIYSITARILS